MRKLIVSQFISIDGVIEAPGGEPNYPHTGWVIPFHTDELVAMKEQEALEASALLIGRVTYESFAEGWAPRTGRFADQMNAMPKHVVSTTLQNPAWNNTHVISRDVVAQIRALKQQPGGPLLTAGSRTLVHTLFEHHLIDELRLLVFPVILGSGFRLFADSPQKLDWKQVGHRALANGTMLMTYHPHTDQA